MAKIDSYDAFQFTMFFLRLQFEKQIPFRIKNLGSIAIEQMLDQFDVVEWRTECACLCKRIVGTRGRFLFHYDTSVDIIQRESLIIHATGSL